MPRLDGLEPYIRCIYRKTTDLQHPLPLLIHATGKRESLDVKIKIEN